MAWCFSMPIPWDRWLGYAGVVAFLVAGVLLDAALLATHDRLWRVALAACIVDAAVAVPLALLTFVQIFGSNEEEGQAAQVATVSALLLWFAYIFATTNWGLVMVLGPSHLSVLWLMRSLLMFAPIMLILCVAVFAAAPYVWRGVCDLYGPCVAYMHGACAAACPHSQYDVLPDV